MESLPGYVWGLVAVGVLGLPAWTCVALYGSAVRAGLDRRTVAAVAGGAAAVLAGWIAASSLLAHAGAYEQDADTSVPWQGLVFLAVLASLLLATRIPAISRALAAPGATTRLALPHTVRVVGVLFVLVLALGRLPAVFALPAGLGDIAVGLSAPFVALRLARGTGRRRAVWFNIAGIVDLVVAIGLGFLAGLGPVRPLDVHPTTAALGTLPLALVATVAVPLAIVLHVVSLRSLARTAPQPDPLDARRLQPASG